VGQKHRSKRDAARLERVYECLDRAGKAGVTTYQLIVNARTTQPQDAMYELRCHGVDIVSEWECVGDRKYKRYWLGQHRVNA
jgi:hypothetical protein